MNGNHAPQITKLTKKFLCAASIKSISCENFKNLTWDEQELLIKQTVCSNLVKKYPLKIAYQITFLKTLIHYLEESGVEIHDLIYESYGRLVASNDDTKSHKHYMTNNNCTISLKENVNFISEATTGLCTWQASLALSEWCLENKNILQHKTILELGSGVGLTGLTVGLLCGPKKIILSDCHPTVLKVLSENIQLNLETIEPSSTENWFYNGTEISVLNLPWENVTKKLCCEISIDLILAADVVYDPDLFKPLLNTFTTFLVHGTAKKIILACTERNKITLEKFLKLLSEDFVFEDMILVPQNNFVWDYDTPIRIFAIHRKIW